MKKLAIVLLSLLFQTVIYAEDGVSIPVDPEPIGPSNPGGRSIVLAPTASLGASSLSIAYPLDAVSVVQIVDEATDAVVYSGSFGATRLVVIDLEEEGLTTGNYRLRIFVFGEWWGGEFEINE